MNFELSTENKTQSDDHDIEFVKNPINFLEWFKSFLTFVIIFTSELKK